MSAVPVVDEAGALLGAVTANDIRAMVADEAAYAQLATPLGSSAVLARPVPTCTPDDTLEGVLRRIDGHYQAYLLDAARRPIGVIALRELIAQFVCEPDDSTMSDYFS